MKKLKIGIVGCGWFGNVHLENLLKMNNVEITALCTQNQEKLDQTGKKVPEANKYIDYEDMFKHENLDAVVIAITPERHGNIEATAAQYGVHFYVEKPLGLDMTLVNQNLQAIEKSGIITSVGYHERYSSALQNIKEILKNKKIGLVVGKWIGDMPQVSWWSRKDQSGGQIIEQTTHIFDCLRFILGEGKVVSSSAIKSIICKENYDIEDASTTTAIFENGALATIITACYLNSEKAKSEIGFEIFTEDEKIIYNWGSDASIVTTAGETIINSQGDLHYTALESFINAIITGDKSKILSDYSDGIKTLQMTVDATNKLMR